jgi:capsular polysaccharide transport system ATP-binding protein
MITVVNVHKRYQTEHGLGPWVLQGVNLTIPRNLNVALIGGNGQGKSTLLKIIGGVDQPSKGHVERLCSVSWPMGYGGGMKGALSGRQNAKFVCRVHGHSSAGALRDRLAYIQDFAQLGPQFDAPVSTYSSGMKSRLQFALSLAIEFDVYISDEVTAAGDAAFNKKASLAFKALANKSSLIMVSHSASTLKQFCEAGIWLHGGQAHWFDRVDDALSAYQESIH